MANQGDMTQAEIAEALGVSQSTIFRELKRGRTTQMNSDLTYRDVYLAAVGARVYKENRQRSRAKSFEEKYSAKFFKKLPDAILSTKQKPRVHSVHSFVHTFRKYHPAEHVPCTKTVYSLIDKGILFVRNIDIPMKTRMRPRKKKPSEPKGTNAKHLGRSIDERDPSVLLRKEIGHGEVDLVLGKKGKDEPVIITMLERVSCIFLTRKIHYKSAEKVQKYVLQMMETYGLEYFKTLTMDNGSEFSTLSQIENDVSHVKVYYTHAYSAWEKGSNERRNGLLKEFIPKGESLKDLTDSQLQLYTDAINDRPKKLGYKTPIECFEEAEGQLQSRSLLG